MNNIPLMYILEGSTIILNHNKYTVVYKGKTGATLSSGTSLLPMSYRKFSAKTSGISDVPDPFIYCELIKGPNGCSAEEFISQYPEYFI